MSYALPTQGPVTGRPVHTPDVFSERTHATARLVVPVLLGLVYGYWAAADRRAGGPITGWNVLFGIVTTIVFAVVMATLLVVGPHLKREVHALMWVAFTGTAFGFLYSQSGASVLRCMLMGLLIGAVTGAALFYWYYTHEDAQGHHLA
ncbi:hypothetical protein [Streptomyces sp. NPDC047000]|uniref:hypothetical protein n=1 Tax=Streptomyces sp. NPDC047000 TaxID=3155474 RepID=UPI003400B3D8